MPRYALVIGISEYQASSLPTLSKPAGDAKVIADLLRKHGDFKTVTLLNQSKLGEEDLWLAFETLLEKQGKGGEILIYFTGHGVIEETRRSQRGFLTSWNCSISEGRVTGGIAFDDLNDLIAKSEISGLVMLLDCCHSGNLLGSAKESFTAFNKTDKDFLLITACRDFEQAAAMKKEDHSLFTGAFLEALAEHRTNELGQINSGSLFGVISDCLQKRKQEPIYLGHGRAMKIVDYRQVVKSETQLLDESPYVGLEAFTKETAKYFKGRDRFIRLLLQKLNESNFVPVIGASGSGKSSLVRAGLIPALEEQGGWEILPPIKPGDSPLDPKNEISRVLTQLCSKVKNKPKISNEIAAGNLAAAVALIQPDKKLLLVVDQFEEVFTVCPADKEAERQQFMDLLVGIAGLEDSPLQIVTTMRADFFENCLAYRGLGEILQAHQVLLLPMDAGELETAIMAPTEVAQYQFENGLKDLILRDVQQEKNFLPLLEFALTQLWEKRDGRTFTLAAYRDDIGGVMGALNAHAEEVYGELEPEEKAWAKQIFLKLVRTGQGNKDTRQRQPKADLLALVTVDEQESLGELLDFLVSKDSRLLVTDGKEAWIDLAHEALLEGWQRFAAWRAEDRELRRLADRVQDAYKEWLAKDKNEDYFLPNGLMLEVREQWEKVAPESTPMVQEYYQLSEQNSKDRIALIERNLTEIKLREEAMRVANLIPMQRTKEMLMAIQNAGESQEKLKIILNPVQTNLQQAIAHMPLANIFQGHKFLVTSVAFSPDGKSIVSGSDDKTIRLWDLQGNQIGQPFQGHRDSVRSVAFSPDGKSIVSGSNDKTIRLWDLQGNQIGQPFQGHRGFVISVAFSPDGKSIVSGGDDKMLRLWDLQGNQIGQPFQGHEDTISSVAFSPDGKSIVSGGDDKMLRLWDLQGNQIGQPFQGHKKSLNSVAFSPDGKAIISGSSDKTLRLWDLQGNQIGQPFHGHENGLNSVAFSPDGKAIVSGSLYTLRLWDLQGNQIGDPFQGHEDAISSVAFSPDGKSIVSGSYDKTIRLWDLQGNQIGQPFQGHRDSVRSVAFSPDGKSIVSGSNDKTLRLWHGGWEAWLEVCCNRLRYHPVFKNPPDDVARSACEVCRKYVWDKEKVES